MGLRNKAHDLIINSKTMKGINKAVCIMMKAKILTPLLVPPYTVALPVCTGGDHLPY